MTRSFRDDLEAQAERQRLRAPEPGPPELVPFTYQVLDYRGGERALKLALLVPVGILAALAVWVNPWIFWIGMVVLAIAISVVMSIVTIDQQKGP